MSAALQRYFEYEIEGIKSETLENNILSSSYYGSLSGIKASIEEMPSSINAKDKFTGRTAFMIAAALGNYSVVEFLSAQPNLDFTAKDLSGYDALDLAWSSGNASVVRLIDNLMYPSELIDDAEPTPGPPSGP